MSNVNNDESAPTETNDTNAQYREAVREMIMESSNQTGNMIMLQAKKMMEENR